MYKTQSEKHTTCRIQVEMIFIKPAPCFPCTIKLPLLDALELLRNVNVKAVFTLVLIVYLFVLVSENLEK